MYTGLHFENFIIQFFFEIYLSLIFCIGSHSAEGAGEIRFVELYRFTHSPNQIQPINFQIRARVLLLLPDPFIPSSLTNLKLSETLHSVEYFENLNHHH